MRKETQRTWSCMAWSHSQEWPGMVTVCQTLLINWLESVILKSTLYKVFTQFMKIDFPVY